MKCFLSSGYTEDPKVVKEITCKGPAVSVLFRDLGINSDDKIEVIVCLPETDLYMATARFELRTIGTNRETGQPLKGILVSPPHLNKPFPPGTKLAVVMAEETQKEEENA